MAGRTPPKCSERRAKPRFEAIGIRASIKVKGQFGVLSAEALDFNRHGMAIILDRALTKNKSLLVTLKRGNDFIGGVVGIVHNCRASSDGFRCGIQFRTQSVIQMDQVETEQQLVDMENKVAVDNAPDSAA
jgi:hypothetical protein